MQQADNKNIDPDIFEKITQSLNTYSGNLESDSDEEKSPYKPSLQGSVTDLSTVKFSGRGYQADHEDAATESSSSGVEKKSSEKNKDVQTASDLGSVKAESDSSTSVETEKSDE
jgi:hypothetical protein